MGLCGGRAGRGRGQGHLAGRGSNSRSSYRCNSRRCCTCWRASTSTPRGTTAWGASGRGGWGRVGAGRGRPGGNSRSSCRCNSRRCCTCSRVSTSTPRGTTACVLAATCCSPTACRCCSRSRRSCTSPSGCRRCPTPRRRWSRGRRDPAGEHGGRDPEGGGWGQRS